MGTRVKAGDDAVDLNQYERRQLKKIQRWFEHTDPRLVALLSGRHPARRDAWRKCARLVVDLLGAVCLVSGVVVALPLLFPGFLLLMAGACLHTAACRHDALLRQAPDD
ncbi:DUF3040 domain-containing protein [Actinosynnema sp. NPDC059797]